MTIREGVVRFGKPLIGYFVRRTHNEPLARDLAQDTWINVIEKWDPAQVERAAGAFLFATARNVLLHFWEHERRFQRIVPTLLVFGSSTPVAGCRYCAESAVSLGLCEMHYTRARRGGAMLAPRNRQTDETVAEVRRLLASGVKGREVAKRLGLYESYVSKIKTGKLRAAA